MAMAKWQEWSKELAPCEAQEGKNVALNNVTTADNRVGLEFTIICMHGYCV